MDRALTHDSQVNLAAVEVALQASGGGLHQVNLDPGVADAGNA
jgi:hypothetical protein